MNNHESLATQPKKGAPMIRRVFPRHLLGVVLCLACCSSCGGTDPLPERDLTPATSVGQHMVWLDRNNDEALLLDVGAARPRPEVRSVEFSAAPQSFERRNEHDELLVLLAEAEEDQGKLAVLDERGVQREYDLGTEFDALEQSDDGRYAIAYYDPNGGVRENANLLFNPNEIAIIDLDADGEDAVVQRTLRSLGSAPRRIEFSPPMDIAGQERRLAIVFFQSEIALLDLSHQDRPEYTVELSRGSSLNLNEIRFSAEEQKIYLLANNSTDVYVLRLLPAGDNRENDFEPSLNQLGTDATPRDMAIFELGDEQRLLVASASSAQVVEASSSRVTQIPLVHQAQRIMLFEGASPFDDVVEQRALLYSIGSGGLTFLDLEDIEERTTRNREELTVSPVASVTMLEENQVLLTHNGGSVSVLDLEERTAAPIQARLPLDAMIPSLETGRIWVAPNGDSTLGFIDLANLHPGQVRLDLPISGLLLFSELDEPRVVTTHVDAAGSVTILNAAEPDNEKRAFSLVGFFMEGVLDR